MTRRGVFLFLAGALVLAGIILAAWWPIRQATQKEQAAVSLNAAWQARTLTLHPNGCVELRGEKGRRAFIFVNKAWRECPKK